MICYFTGTGNSAYVASRIAGQTEQEVLNLFEKIRSQDHTALHSEKPWVIVCPTYAWRIPRILSDWLKQTPLTGSRNVYFVMTCGGLGADRNLTIGVGPGNRHRQNNLGQA